MGNELLLDDELEALWHVPPFLLDPAMVARLQLDLGNVVGRRIGIAQDLLARASAGGAPEAVEIADRIRDNDAAFPDRRRRTILAILVVLPAAHARNRTALQRLVALLVQLQAFDASPTFGELFAGAAFERLSELAECWMAWAVAGLPSPSEDFAPTREEIAEAIDRIVCEGSGAARRNMAIPRVQVVEAIPDATETQLAACLQRYEKLTQPLRLSRRADARDLETLDRDFPHFSDVTRGIRDDMRLAEAARTYHLNLAPRLVVGPPGAGKSRYLRALAESLGRPLRVLPAATGEIRALVGTARGWSSAVPSFPATAICETGYADPILGIDEIDKGFVHDSTRPSLQAALLAMIEPATARSYYDECLAAECDFSWIGWFLTANTLDHIARPLLDRCRVHRVGGPLRDAFEVYYEGILADIARDLGVSPAGLPELEPRAVQALRDGFRRRPELRTLKRATRSALALARPATIH